jgi:hypothetical protein
VAAEFCINDTVAQKRDPPQALHINFDGTVGLLEVFVTLRPGTSMSYLPVEVAVVAGLIELGSDGR